MRETSSDNHVDSALVGIVIIGYNQEKYISAALKSALSQSHRNIEVVMMDDGSTDRTLEIAREFANSDPRLKVHSQINQGPSVARSNGAHFISASAMFISFLDGDDIQHPDFVSTALTYFDQNPDVTAIIPNLWNIDEHGKVIEKRPLRRWTASKLGLPKMLASEEPATPFTTFYCASGTVPFFIARHEAYKALLGWDARLWPFEDTDMLCQLAISGLVHALPEKLIGYRVHAGQGTQSGAQRSKHWNPISDQVMREKWNIGTGLNSKQRAKVRAACIYHRQIHQPLMIVSVAGRSFGEFLRNPTWKRLKWFFWLARQSIWRLLYFKIFFWRAGPSWNPVLAEEGYKGLGRGDALPRPGLDSK